MVTAKEALEKTMQANDKYIESEIPELLKLVNDNIENASGNRLSFARVEVYKNQYEIEIFKDYMVRKGYMLEILDFDGKKRWRIDIMWN